MARWVSGFIRIGYLSDIAIHILRRQLDSTLLLGGQGNNRK